MLKLGAATDCTTQYFCSSVAVLAYFHDDQQACPHLDRSYVTELTKDQSPTSSYTVKCVTKIEIRLFSSNWNVSPPKTVEV